MAQSTPDIPRTRSSVYVASRFLARLTFFAAFATLSCHGLDMMHGLDRMMVCALALMALYCTIAAFVRRETVFSPVLTHWDEAAAYGLVYTLLMRLA